MCASLAAADICRPSVLTTGTPSLLKLIQAEIAAVTKAGDRQETLFYLFICFYSKGSGLKPQHAQLPRSLLHCGKETLMQNPQ